MARKKESTRTERQFNSGYFFHIADLLPRNDFNGYGFGIGKTFAAPS